MASYTYAHICLEIILTQYNGYHDYAFEVLKGSGTWLDRYLYFKCGNGCFFPTFSVHFHMFHQQKLM